jgi:hypothetical protein
VTYRPLRRVPPSRMLVLAALTVMVLARVHCTSSGPGISMVQRERVSFWNPHLLYLKAVPHTSMYIEIDAVEGSGPDAREIARLVEFLKKYCDKPGGIMVDLDPAIPGAAASGESEGSLALRYLDGPPREAAARNPAFLYILYYDSTRMGKGDRAEPVPDKPHVSLLPYPAVIFIDRHYNPWGHDMWDLFVMHEMGHLLGLTRNLDHGDGMHCDDRACLMNEKARIGFFNWLLGRERPGDQSDICGRCKLDLERYMRMEPDPDLRFVGPVLVRGGEGYSVVSLPGLVELYVGDPQGLDYRDILADARRASAGLREDSSVWVYYREAADMENRNMRVPAALENARKDPYELVRRIAERELAAWFESEWADF